MTVPVLCYQDTEYSGIYSALSDLRDEKMELLEKVNEAKDTHTQDKLKQELEILNNQIEEQLDNRRKRYATPPPLLHTPARLWSS